MPERLMEAVDALGSELDKLRTVVDHQRRLSRLLVGVIIVLAVLMAGFAVLAVSARHTAEDVQANFSADAIARESQRITACRVLNQGNELAREGLGAYTDGILGLITNPETRANVEAKLRGSIPLAATQDRDCVAPAGLGPEDYPG